MSEFTHFDAAGNALMVDVSDKADTARVAVAQGKICVSREIYEKLLPAVWPRVMCWAWRASQELWRPSAPVS